MLQWRVTRGRIMELLCEYDGIHYLITISAEVNGQYSAQWKCSQCNHSVQSTACCASEAEAIGRAEVDAYLEHHLQVHAITNRGIHARRRAKA